jgi:hypothetical protein
MNAFGDHVRVIHSCGGGFPKSFRPSSRATTTRESFLGRASPVVEARRHGGDEPKSVPIRAQTPDNASTEQSGPSSSSASDSLQASHVPPGHPPTALQPLEVDQGWLSVAGSGLIPRLRHSDPALQSRTVSGRLGHVRARGGGRSSGNRPWLLASESRRAKTSRRRASLSSRFRHVAHPQALTPASHAAEGRS